MRQIEKTIMMVALNLNISITTIDINDLNTPNKGQKLSDLQLHVTV